MDWKTYNNIYEYMNQYNIEHDKAHENRKKAEDWSKYKYIDNLTLWSFGRRIFECDHEWKKENKSLDECISRVERTLEKTLRYNKNGTLLIHFDSEYQFNLNSARYPNIKWIVLKSEDTKTYIDNNNNIVKVITIPTNDVERKKYLSALFGHVN